MTGITKHIFFARDWLNKAELKIEREKMIEGELFLSLAEAEVHKAWESSVKRRKKATERESTFLLEPLKKGLVVLALVLLILFAGFKYYSIPADGPSLKLSLPRVERTVGNGLHRDGPRLIKVDLIIGNRDQ